MIKIFTFLFFLLTFPSFLNSSLQQKSTGLSQGQFSSEEVFLSSFSFQPSFLEKQIFEKPKLLFLQNKREKAFLELKAMKEERIKKMVFPKKSFFHKISFYKNSFSEQERKKRNQAYIRLIHLRNFALGFFSYENNRWDRAIYYFKKSFRQSFEDFQGHTNLNPYIHLFLGQSYRKKELYEDAENEFKKIEMRNLPSSLSYQIRFELSLLSIQNKHWSEAKKSLQFLEKKWRTSLKHPEILWNLIYVERQRKNFKKACHWARKMYSIYPTHPLVFDWTLNLENAFYKGKKLNCQALYKHKKRRIKTLQFSGEEKKAEVEIKKIRKEILTKKTQEIQKRIQAYVKNAKPNSQRKKRRIKRNKQHNLAQITKRVKEEVNKEFHQDIYDADKILAFFLIKKGHPHKAMDSLLKYDKNKKEDFDYVRLLGKAAESSGKYQTAVDSYYQFYKKQPTSNRGRKALFFSAFLSYRFQDYDEALKKFKEFTVKYKRSYFTPNAYWYLAWIKYLQKDFERASLSFKKILRMREQKKGRWMHVSDEKLKYWLAMSYTKNHQRNQAEKIFLNLMSNKLLNYYTIAAFYRYNNLTGVEPIRNLVHYHQNHQKSEYLKGDVKKISSHESIQDDIQESEEDSQDKEEAELISEIEEGEEGEEKRSFTKEQKNNGKNFENQYALQSSNFNAKKELVSQRLKNYRVFRKNLEKARDLSLIGAFHWAKWELYDVEVKTKRFKYLKLLMEVYKDIQSFHRSAYISTVYFGSKRKDNGILGEKNLWKEAFPQVYYHWVNLEANKLHIPKELIWSIMRAESKYRSDIVSPVGAEGLMQIMPYTAKKVLEKLIKKSNSYYQQNLKNPQANIKIGTRYLKRLLKKFENQIPLAAASYNAGPHRVKHWLYSFGFLDMDEFIEHIPFTETRRYVKKVIRNYKIYQYLYGKKVHSMDWLVQSIAMEMKNKKELVTRETW